MGLNRQKFFRPWCIYHERVGVVCLFPGRRHFWLPNSRPFDAQHATARACFQHTHNAQRSVLNAQRPTNFASRIHCLCCAPLMAAAAGFHRSMPVSLSMIPTSTKPEFIRTATTRPPGTGNDFEAQSVLMAVDGVGWMGKTGSCDGMLDALSMATAALFEMMCMWDRLKANPDARVASKDLRKIPATNKGQRMRGVCASG